MEWQDDAVVIGLRRHGETSVVLELFSAAHGRHLGLVRGGRSRRLRPTLQPGNEVLATWRARTDDHLGTFTLEPLRLRAAKVMESAATLHALNHLCALVRLVPERDPHAALQRRMLRLLAAIDTSAPLGAMIVRFELALLADLGFGLDLARCAATGVTEDLAFVSPKSGRAVCRAAGEPYRDRILRLPAFLRTTDSTERGRSADTQPEDPEDDGVSVADLEAGFRLTEFFLVRDVFGPRGLDVPESRRAYLATVSQANKARPEASAVPDAPPAPGSDP